jgi:hypothetical protein
MIAPPPPTEDEVWLQMADKLSEINSYEPYEYLYPITEVEEEMFPDNCVISCRECGAKCFYNTNFPTNDSDDEPKLLFKIHTSDNTYIKYYEADKGQFCGKMCWMRWGFIRTKSFDVKKQKADDIFPSYNARYETRRLTEEEYCKNPYVEKILAEGISKLKNARSDVDY